MLGIGCLGQFALGGFPTGNFLFASIMESAAATDSSDATVISGRHPHQPPIYGPDAVRLVKTAPTGRTVC
jgi:hypothetical protein